MKARSATWEAKRDALAAQLRRRGALHLDHATYQSLSHEGFTRVEVARAVEAGEATATAERGTVVVRLTGKGTT